MNSELYSVANSLFALRTFACGYARVYTQFHVNQTKGRRNHSTKRVSESTGKRRINSRGKKRKREKELENGIGNLLWISRINFFFLVRYVFFFSRLFCILFKRSDGIHSKSNSIFRIQLRRKNERERTKETHRQGKQQQKRGGNRIKKIDIYDEKFDSFSSLVNEQKDGRLSAKSWIETETERAKHQHITREPTLCHGGCCCLRTIVHKSQCVVHRMKLRMKSLLLFFSFWLAFLWPLKFNKYSKSYINYHFSRLEEAFIIIKSQCIYAF